MKNKNILSLICALLVIAVFGGVGCSASSGTESNEAQNQTAVARTGNLALIASGTGQVIPASEITLGFGEGGKLIELLVDIGDQVQSGDVLARLEINTTSAQLASEIAGAELALTEAEQQLTGLYETANMDAALALVAVESAQKNLDALKDTQVEQALALQAITEAEIAVLNAEDQLSILQSTASEEAIYIAFASALFKEQDLEATRQQIEKLKHDIPQASNPAIKERLQEQLLQLYVKEAQLVIDYENALYKHEHIDAPPNLLDVTTAEARLVTAQAQLAEAQRAWEKIKDGPLPGEIAQAEAELKTARESWEKHEDGPDPDALVLAEASLQVAELNLALIQNTQLILELVAPQDGTVLSIAATAGQEVNPQTARALITLANLSHPMVEVNLDETDLDKIAAGYAAEIVFDALPEKTFSGEVVKVGPSLESVSGVQAIKALVALDWDAAVGRFWLPVGLSASVDVIAKSAENAVIIPVEALHQESPGEFSVSIMENDTVIQRAVQVGLVDVTSAEIISGLQIGEVVLTWFDETE